MEQPRALITRQIPSIAQELLSQRYEVDVISNGLTLSQWAEAVKSYDAILSVFYDKLTADILSQATKVKIISNYAVGLDNIDIEMANKKNIRVCHLPHIVTDSTADLALGLLLNLARNIIPASNFVKSGQWTTPLLFDFCGQELRAKTLGIIGFGRIGQAVAKRAISFGMNIVFCAKKQIMLNQLPEWLEKNKIKQVDFDALIETSDFVSLHIPDRPENVNIINQSVLSKMKPTASLLNLGRGTAVDTEALYQALKSNRIRAAGLDVTYPEPLKDHPITKLPNCVIVPHIGTTTEECRYEMAKQAALNILNC